MALQGLAMVQIDMPGHGYSQGERAWIKKYQYWINDYLQVRFFTLCDLLHNAFLERNPTSEKVWLCGCKKLAYAVLE